MKLIFGILAAVTLIIISLVSSGIYWSSSSDLYQAKMETSKLLATEVAFNLAIQMAVFEQIVAQIAANESVIAAVENPDLSAREKTAIAMQKLLPNALKIRLLAPDVNAIDTSASPVMGYADLEMVKKTLTSKQRSIIQGEGADRHLAMTAKISQGSKVVGVVLASLKFDFVIQTLAKAPLGSDYLEISQEPAVLVSGGNAELKSTQPQQIPVDNTAWTVSYWSAGAASTFNLSKVVIQIAVASLITFAALLFAYFQLTLILKKDQRKVLDAIRDLMQEKRFGRYPVNLDEMRPIIATLAQLKRVIDNKLGKEVDENTENPEDTSSDSPNRVTTTLGNALDSSLASLSFFKKKSE